MRRADGAEEPVSAHLQSVPWGSGKSLMLSLQPLSKPAETAVPSLDPAPDHSQAEAELERVQALLDEMRAIVDTATDGVILITPEGTIRMLSRPAEALFGMDASAVSGQPFISLCAIESQRAIRDYLTALTDNGVASVLNDGREVI